MFYHQAIERRYKDPPPHIYLTFQLAFFQSPVHFIYTNFESDNDVIDYATEKRFGLADVAQRGLPVTIKNHLVKKRGL
jgi:hypothetical protein